MNAVVTRFLGCIFFFLLNIFFSFTDRESHKDNMSSSAPSLINQNSFFSFLFKNRKNKIPLLLKKPHNRDAEDRTNSTIIKKEENFNTFLWIISSFFPRNDPTTTPFSPVFLPLYSILCLWIYKFLRQNIYLSLLLCLPIFVIC